MTATTTTTEVATQVAHEAGKAGMPQLDFTMFPNQIFWLLITLTVIYFVLSRIALPRIGSVLENRAAKITSDLAAADELKNKALSAEKAYHDALTQARAEANKIIADAKLDIQKDLNTAIAISDAEIVAKAAESEKKIGEIRAGAAEAISQVAKDTAKELVAALGGAADARAITAAVTARLKG
jgi:F-type H+-transporting ATPase subunit b